MDAAPAQRKDLITYVAPFAIFMLGIAVVQAIQKFAGNSENLLLAEPAYWVFPLQAIACAIALVVFWRRYDFGSQKPIPLAIGVGLLDFVLWVSPQMLFGQPARVDGFDPTTFSGQPALYWGTIVARMLRLVIVVPLVEEIFWRGFLQRYLIRENFTAVPFGKYTHFSFWAVVIAFMFVHHSADWPAAFVTGALFGWVAVKTKSLIAVVIAHATCNLALGIYILATKQWGFW